MRPATDGVDDVDLVGDLVLPCELATGSFESVHLGRLDLPMPFAPGDLAELRSHSDRLRILMATHALGEGRLALTPDALGAASEAGFNLRAVLELAPAVEAMRHWPRRRGRRTVRYPPEIVRGLPDEPMTFRDAAAGKVRLVDGQPMKSVRHLVAPEPWSSRRLAALLQEAAGELDEAAVASRLANELRRTAARSEPRSRRADVPRSAWPLKFRILWEAALALLTSPRRAPGPGADLQPLQPAWSLYQDWVASVVIDGLCEVYGPFSRGGYRREGVRLRPRFETPLVGWITDDWVVDLWITPTIGARGSPSHLMDVYGGQPAPDILIVRRARAVLDDLGDSPPDAIETVVVDAKRYTGSEDEPGVLSRTTVATMASKYLWSLRRADDPNAFPLDLVLLVSPGGGGEFLDAARTQVARARPGHRDALGAFVRGFQA